MCYSFIPDISPSQFKWPLTFAWSWSALASNYNIWLWALRKSGFILCRLSLQVSWSSSHTEWMTAGLDCHWLAWSTSAGWVGVVWLQSVTATLENKPSIHCWEEPQRRAEKSPEERPQRPSPYSTTLTHAMLVHCQIRGTRTQYTLTPIPTLWKLFCNPSRSRTFQWTMINDN